MIAEKPANAMPLSLSLSAVILADLLLSLLTCSSLYILGTLRRRGSSHSSSAAISAWKIEIWFFYFPMNWKTFEVLVSWRSGHGFLA